MPVLRTLQNGQNLMKYGVNLMKYGVNLMKYGVNLMKYGVNLMKYGQNLIFSHLPPPLLKTFHHLIEVILTSFSPLQLHHLHHHCVVVKMMKKMMRRRRKKWTYLDHDVKSSFEIILMSNWESEK